MAAPDVDPGQDVGRSWPRWLIGWFVGVGGALIVPVSMAFLAPQWAWPSQIVAWIGGALVMGGIGHARGILQWLLVLVAVVVGWIIAAVLIALLIFRLMWGGPEAIG